MCSLNLPFDSSLKRAHRYCRDILVVFNIRTYGVCRRVIEFDAYHRGLFLGAVTSPPAAPPVGHMYADMQAACLLFGCFVVSNAPPPSG